MKKIILIASTIFISTWAIAQIKEHNTDTSVGAVYGSEFKIKKPLTGEKFIKKTKKVGEKVDMQIEGEVLDVCSKKGCWANVKLDNGTVVFTKMKDYAFFLPMEGLVGKKVVLDGEGYKEVFSVEELQHYAADAKKSQEEINAITEPETKYRFTAKGIKVVE